MKTFRVVLSTIRGFRQWVEVIEGKDERDVRDVVIARYGVGVLIVKVA